MRLSGRRAWGYPRPLKEKCMKPITKLMRLFHAERLNPSVYGNPRWRLVAITPSGNVMEFRTASDVHCAYGCDLSRLKPSTVIKVRYHWTRADNLIADYWEDDRDTGIDFSAEFDALEEAAKLDEAAMPTQAHNQVRSI
jgi:hypothetical protein